MTLFDVFSKREADDTGLPQQATDDELLAWGMDLRVAPPPAAPRDEEQRPYSPRHMKRRPLRATPAPTVDEPLEVVVDVRQVDARAAEPAAPPSQTPSRSRWPQRTRPVPPPLQADQAR